jgi:hydrogenase expression/formation protein HypC
MCLALPGKVLTIVDPAAGLACVDIQGTPREVNVSLLDGVAAGQWVLVSTGFAVARLSEAEAAEAVRLFEELGDALENAAAGIPEVGGP